MRSASRRTKLILSRGEARNVAASRLSPTGGLRPALTRLVLDSNGASVPKRDCVQQWVKADRLHPLIPRESRRSRKLYKSRGAVERGFGRLKNEWALLPLRIRGLDRVRLHADLTILAQLACALADARAAPLAA